jgi:hypothetical protein
MERADYRDGQRCARRFDMTLPVLRDRVSFLPLLTATWAVFSSDDPGDPILGSFAYEYWRFPWQTLAKDPHPILSYVRSVHGCNCDETRVYRQVTDDIVRSLMMYYDIPAVAVRQVYY